MEIGNRLRRSKALKLSFEDWPFLGKEKSMSDILGDQKGSQDRRKRNKTRSKTPLFFISKLNPPFFSPLLSSGLTSQPPSLDWQVLLQIKLQLLLTLTLIQPLLALPIFLVCHFLLYSRLDSSIRSEFQMKENMEAIWRGKFRRGSEGRVFQVWSHRRERGFFEGKLLGLAVSLPFSTTRWVSPFLRRGKLVLLLVAVFSNVSLYF